MNKECDYCESTENLKSINDSMVCPDCITKGIHQANQNQVKAKETMNAPISINEVLTQSREIDSRINIRTDIFNSETVALVDIKKAIDEDSTIENKPYALATEVMNRLNHYKQVIFEKNKELNEIVNKQNAIQVYLNQLANQLRAEEREKLKLQDINYKPNSVRNITPKQIKLAKPRLDKKELRKYASELGVAEFTLQMLVVSKGISVQQAAELLRKSLESAKAQISETK